MERIYFEDIEPGQEVVSARRTLTDADILAFCGLSGDFNALHTDIEFIREETPYRDRIAHGHLVMSISGGLRSDLDHWHIIAYVECSRQFVAPVYAGDTIRFTARITETRRSRSRPELGVVRYEIETANQDGLVVQRGPDVLLVGARDTAAST